MRAEAEGSPLRIVLRDEDTLLWLLRQGRRLLVEHPEAARALVRAFVAEGRRYAQTPEGRARKAALARSDLVRQGRLIWHACGLDDLVYGEPALLPSEWLAVIAEALRGADLEQVLTELMGKR